MSERISSAQCLFHKETLKATLYQHLFMGIRKKTSHKQPVQHCLPNTFVCWYWEYDTHSHMPYGPSIPALVCWYWEYDTHPHTHYGPSIHTFVCSYWGYDTHSHMPYGQSIHALVCWYWEGLILSSPRFLHSCQGSLIYYPYHYRLRCT